jgi:hypothetical protein
MRECWKTGILLFIRPVIRLGGREERISVLRRSAHASHLVVEVLMNLSNFEFRPVIQSRDVNQKATDEGPHQWWGVAQVHNQSVPTWADRLSSGCFSCFPRSDSPVKNSLYPCDPPQPDLLKSPLFVKIPTENEWDNGDLGCRGSHGYKCSRGFPPHARPSFPEVRHLPKTACPAGSVF